MVPTRTAIRAPGGSQLASDAARIAGVAFVYLLVARLSLRLQFHPEGIAAIWPPSGIFLSALLLVRREARPALVLVLALTDLLVERSTGTRWPVSAAYALVLAADASLSTWLLLRVLGAPPTFERTRDFGAFVLLSVIFSNGLMGLVAAATAWLDGAPSFWDAWYWWAASDGIGNLIVTPLVLSTAARARGEPRRWRAAAAELSALLLLLLLVQVVAFTRHPSSDHLLLLLTSTSLPFQIWAALRLGVGGVAAVLLLIAAVTVGFTASGGVSGAGSSPLPQVVALQLYLALTALPSLFLATTAAERRRTEAERERLREQMEAAQRLESLGRLSGGIAHDFNNMLTVILGRTQLALERVDPVMPLHADLLEVRDAARRSADLTSRLLAFARRQTVAPRVLDLNARIGEALKMLQRLIGEDVQLVFRPGEGLWSVRIDPSQVDQILANLCVNARDAIAGTGSVRIETSNATLDGSFGGRTLGAAKGEYVLLSVADDGSGMTREVLDHVFEPFFTTKEPGRGSGLGLATVYGILKQNGGAIHAYSEPGLGTTFKLYLPRAVAVLERPAAPAPLEPPRGRGERLLVVDDDEAIRSLVRSMLERIGYEALLAGSPAEAVRLAGTHAGEIHLLLTDVVLPQMNGRQLAERVVALRPAIRCLYMSGHAASLADGAPVLDEGAPFLPKPFTLQELATKVRESLDRR